MPLIVFSRDGPSDASRHLAARRPTDSETSAPAALTSLLITDLSYLLKSELNLRLYAAADDSPRASRWLPVEDRVEVRRKRAFSGARTGP